MNYTNNYHLPQWEKSDRVLMEDFNQAMSDIESSLDGAEEKTAALDEKNCNMLRRAAYNHYHLVAEAEDFPRQMGAFHQCMDPLPENAQGFIQREGFAWLAGGSAASREDLLAALVQESPLVTSLDSASRNTPLVLTFTAPSAMYLERIQMQSMVYVGPSDCTEAVLYTLTDLTEGKTVKTGRYSNSLSAGIGGLAVLTLSFGGYLKLGHRYKLVAEATTAGYRMEMNLNDKKTYVTATGYGSQTGTLTYTLSETEKSRMGLVLVRYAPETDASCFTLTWDGEVCPFHKVRTAVWPDGKTYKEAEFLRMGEIPEGSRLVLSADCGPTRELALYEWGAIVI